MFPVIHSVGATPDNSFTNGRGVLSDCLECKVTETLNGDYSLSMRYPLNGIHADEIERGRIITADTNKQVSHQLFRIDEVDKNYITGEISVYALHISRDLKNYSLYLDDNLTDGVWRNRAYDWISVLNDSTNYKNTCPFTFEMPDNIHTRALKMNYTPGQSILDFILENEKLKRDPPLFEMAFIGYAVKFYWKRRGTQYDFSVRYGRNLTSMETKEKQELNYYACIPCFRYKATITTGSGTREIEKFLYGDFNTASDYLATNPTRNAYTVKEYQADEIKEKFDFDDSDGLSSAEKTGIVSALNQLAREWNADNADGRADPGPFTINFTFVETNRQSDYWFKPNEGTFNGGVGDYIYIYHEDFGRRSAEIVQTVYDNLAERFDSITAGQPIKTLARTIRAIATNKS